MSRSKVNSSVTKSIIFVLLVFSQAAFSLSNNYSESKSFYNLIYQEEKFSRDTSYTLKSALEKVRKQYSFVEPVEASNNLEINEKKNIVYAELGNRKLKLDLFIPLLKKDKYPAVILIHGGGWSSGNKELMIPLAQKIASNNFVTAAVEYRLSPEAHYPAAVKDIRKAIKYLKKNAGKYCIDTNRIAVLGTSAGGHLAALVGTAFRKYQDKENISAEVQAIIDVDGILDFTHPAESAKDTNEASPSVGKRWLGFSYAENPEIWREASPLKYIDKNTPPILFINSSIPRFHAGRDSAINKMNELGIYSEVHTINDSPHSFWLFKPWFQETLDYILLFLNKIWQN